MKGKHRPSEKDGNKSELRPRTQGFTAQLAVLSILEATTLETLPWSLRRKSRRRGGQAHVRKYENCTT